MFYIDAKKEILKKYKLNEYSIDVELVGTNKFFNLSNGYFIALICVDGMAELTDMGKTCDYFDITQDALKNLCEKYNLTLDDWTIGTKFNKLSDLDNFIALLDEITEKYSIN